MSRLCEHCGRRIYRPSIRAGRIVRLEPVTEYTCQFCSEACVREWSANRTSDAAAVPPAGEIVNLATCTFERLAPAPSI